MHVLTVMHETYTHAYACLCSCIKLRLRGRANTHVRARLCACASSSFNDCKILPNILLCLLHRAHSSFPGLVMIFILALMTQQTHTGP